MNDISPDQYQDFNKAKDFPHVSLGILGPIGITLLSSIGAMIIIIILPGEYRDSMQPYILAFGQIVFMLIPTLILSRYSPIQFRELFRLKWNKLPIWQPVAAICGLLALQFFFIGWDRVQDFLVPAGFKEVYISMKMELEEVYLTLLGGDTVFALIRALIVGALIPGITEELLFRGIGQRSLEEKFPPVFAVIFIGTLFGIIHFNPIAIIPLITIGIFLGIVAYTTGSILWPILLHILNNVISIGIMYYEPASKIEENSGLLPFADAALLALGSLAVTVVASIILIRGSEKRFFN